MDTAKQNSIVTFSCDDIVRHPRKPEWGQGHVKQVVATVYKGKPGQRVTVDFSNHKRVIINTAVAPLAHDRRVKETIIEDTAKEKPKGGWLSELENSVSGSEHELRRLPDALTDPFIKIESRLNSTLDNYRFSAEPRSLIDWAVTQTGLNDPLSRYTRAEMEQEFSGFARDRYLLLKQLVIKMKRAGKEAHLKQLHNQLTNVQAKDALQKAMG